MYGVGGFNRYFLAILQQVSIPSFGKLIGYVGGVACTVCSLVFPPLMLLKSSEKGELAKWEWISAKLIILLGLGLVAFTLLG